MDLTKPCFHVFAAPELARPICMHLRKPDKASLLRTCRLFFSELRQYLWESANEIIPLVSMIPGGEMIESEVDDIFFPMSYHSTMQLPTVLDLSRLSLYSPYIKSLTMDTQGLSIADEYENWDEFLACAESTPLLPNLEHIQISPSSTICDGHISVECANWIRVFWSPALISFKFTRLNRHFPIFGAPTHVWIGLQDASSFLQSISQRSPRLETLEIFPADVSIRTNSSQGGFAYQSVSGVEYGVISLETSMALSQLRSLRVLVTNSFFLNADAFLALSQLPLLESLSIDGKYGGWQTFASDVRLPDGSFPSLRTLTLKDAIWTSICDLIDQKPLWDSLCTLSIQGYARYDGPETEWDAYMWSKCISRLAKYRSPITSLVFSGAHRQIVDLQMVESLKRLPLVTLSLPSIDTSYPGWDMLFEGIPGIENLTIEPFISDFVPSQLRSIIMMLPRLRELSLPTDRDFMAHLNNETFPSRPRSLVELHLKTNFQLAVNPWHDDEVAANARIVAKFLYSIRPNATYSPGWYYPAFYQGVYWENPLNTSVINETLSRLREESASDPLEISL